MGLDWYQCWFLTKPFDPYPFILLNLTLSCLAAVQAPIILMSPNRQSNHDRIQAIHDCEVNLKAEIEVRLLHKKMDHILNVDLLQLNEMQKIQVDIMKDLNYELDKINH